MLQPDLPCGNAGARQRADQRQRAVDAAYRAVEEPGQADDPDSQVSGALQHTQRAGVQAPDELQVIAKTQQHHADQGCKQKKTAISKTYVRHSGLDPEASQTNHSL